VVEFFVGTGIGMAQIPCPEIACLGFERRRAPSQSIRQALEAPEPARETVIGQAIVYRVIATHWVKKAGYTHRTASGVFCVRGTATLWPTPAYRLFLMKVRK